MLRVRPKFNKYFYLWLAWFVVFAGLSAVGQPARNLNGIYLTNEDFRRDVLKRPHITDSLNFIFVDWAGDLILVRNGHHTQVSIDSIFGFHNGTSKYRTYTKSTTVFRDRGYYKVEDEGAIIVYSRRGWRDTAHSTFYYYSMNSDSDIIWLNRRNLRKLFRHEHLSRSLRKNRSRLYERDGQHLVINNILN